MFNSLKDYFTSGKKAGRAIAQNDHAHYDLEKTWFVSAIMLEKPEDRAAVQQAWDSGYARGRYTLGGY